VLGAGFVMRQPFPFAVADLAEILFQGRGEADRAADDQR
jgi:hypothetical protein